MIVSKFGGTSVGTYEAMCHSAQIIASNNERRMIVISATSGTTNDLIELEDNLLTTTEREEILIRIEDRHRDIIKKHPDSDALMSRFMSMMAEVRNHLEQKVRDNRWKDQLYAFGELISTTIFVEILRDHGVEAEWLDARKVIKTDSSFNRAEPNIHVIRKHAKQVIDTNRTYLTQGFIGADAFGNTTTLGRGGSDYSAALLAEALNASLLEIWTDVAGIFTSDPRLVADAQPIEEITFDEAAELSVFGGKVLHPATVKPAIRKGINVRVAHAQIPELSGTVILPNSERTPSIRAISLRKDQTLLTLKSMDMLHQHGFLARIFSILADYEISVDLVTTSEVSVSLTLDTASKASNKVQLSRDIILELSEFCEVEVERGLALIALIGNKMNQTSGISGPLFNVLNDFNIRLICHGASSHNICFLVRKDDAEEIVKILHKTFIS